MSRIFSGSFAALSIMARRLTLRSIVHVPVDIVAEGHGVLLRAGHANCAAAEYRPRARTAAMPAARSAFRPSSPLSRLSARSNSRSSGQQLLRVEDSLLLANQFGAGFGIVEPRAACEQTQHPILQIFRGSAAGGFQQRIDAGAAGIEQRRARFEARRTAQWIAAIVSSALSAGNAALARRKSARSRSVPASSRHCPSAGNRRRSCPDCAARSIHARIVLSAERWNIVEDRVLRAVDRPAPHQPPHRAACQRLLPVAVEIGQGHEHVERFVVHWFAAEAKSASTTSSGSLQLAAAAAEPRVIFASAGSLRRAPSRSRCRRGYAAGRRHRYAGAWSAASSPRWNGKQDAPDPAW